MRLPFLLHAEGVGECAHLHREMGGWGEAPPEVQGEEPCRVWAEPKRNISAFARQRRANSSRQLLGDRSRTGFMMSEKCIQRKKATDSLLHTAHRS